MIIKIEERGKELIFDEQISKKKKYTYIISFTRIRHDFPGVENSRNNPAWNITPIETG